MFIDYLIECRFCSRILAIFYNKDIEVTNNFSNQNISQGIIKKESLNKIHFLCDKCNSKHETYKLEIINQLDNIPKIIHFI